MLPDRVSNPGPLTYESGALPIALRGPALRLELLWLDDPKLQSKDSVLQTCWMVFAPLESYPMDGRTLGWTLGKKHRH